MERLTALFVKRVAEGRGDPGKYQDGGGLILRVLKGGSANWIFRYQRAGARREMGLGTLSTVSLVMARGLADKQRVTLALGDDPLEERLAVKAKRANLITFDEAAKAFIEAHEPSWKNDKHRQQWRNTIATYVSRMIGDVAVSKMTTNHVVSVLEPIWATKPETASRVRGRIEMVLDWAKARGMRDGGDNPARWRGNMQHMFPAKAKVRTVRHHPAVVVDDAPKLYRRLMTSDGTAAAAVRFCLLTTARPGEVARAQWPEIDRTTKVWTVPPDKQKSKKPHRVALSDEALVILDAMIKRRDDVGDYIFPGGKRGRPLTLASLQKALRVAMRKDLRSDTGDPATTHGSARSTFDNWVSERTSHPQKLIDRAQAHGPRNATIAAYRRSDLLEQRRPLMADWAAYLTGR
jgi:integrase